MAVKEDRKTAVGLLTAIVWEVDRTTGYVPGQQPMNRGTLLAALRQKYGKESYSSTSREGASVRNDRDIADIYWMFDEKGSRLPLPNPTFGQPGYPGCEGRPGTRNVPNAPGQGGSNASAYSTETWGAWCTSVYVGVHLHLQPETSDPDNLIQRVSTDMIDIPLAMRAQKATVDWYHNIGEKQHQLDIQKSKQVQPKL